jgi:hypothetical protein
VGIRKLHFAVVGAFALVLAACQGEARQPEPRDRGAVVGLVSSLPLVMPEAADIAEQLADRSAPHWAMAVLRESGSVMPLDSLSGADGRLPLPAGALLVMAQPWPLSPPENVALDDWVRAGGRVLLFADPMLTFESRFALGDRRRPQDVAMLSPILTRWGLRLERDEAASPETALVAIGAARVPVALPGRFAPVEGSNCEIEASGLLAVCRIGAGRIVALADAALFESRQDDAEATRAAALRTLLALLIN